MVRHEGWRKLDARNGRPFTSFADFCKEREPYGLGHDPEIIDAISGARDTDKIATVVGKHGGDRRSEQARENQPDNDKVEPQYGTSATYLIARLDRDAPELAERVRSGELSAHAAAIEAGFRKRATPLDRLRSAWKSASKTERAAFMDEVA
jgi:hypothetical protein